MYNGKGDIARVDKKIGHHELITTLSTLIDSSAIYNPAHFIGRDTLPVGWTMSTFFGEK